MKKILLIFIVFSTLNCVSQIVGKVVRVKDGDTIVVLDDSKTQYTIRVADIDCPEKKQAFGSKAKWFVSDEIFSKTVLVKKKNKDRYGRIVGYVLYDGKNLSEELLKAGLAWHYKKYSKSVRFQKLEDEARMKKVGLWRDPNAVAPFLFRRKK